MPTDQSELMELFLDIFGLDGRGAGTAAAGFADPMPELARSSATLSELLARETNLLSAIIAGWREAGEIEAADVLARIAAHIAAAAEDGDAPAPRILDYVYPVV